MVAAPFRFTVSCDRDRFKAIEKAARKGGVSAGVFVQRHFDRLFDKARAAGPATLSPVVADEAAKVVARHGVAPLAAQIYLAMREAADEAGEVVGLAGTFAERVTGSRLGARSMMPSLIRAGLIQRLTDNKGRRPDLWRVAR